MPIDMIVSAATSKIPVGKISLKILLHG